MVVLFFIILGAILIGVLTGLLCPKALAINFDCSIHDKPQKGSFMTTTAPIFIVQATPTDPSTFFTTLDDALADANSKAKATPDQEFLVFEARKSAILPTATPVDSDITPQV